MIDIFLLCYYVDKEILFPYSYPYTSSTTKILRENFADLYKETKKIINLNKNDLIIDIGSNDGNLLSNFKNNHRVLGVTPEKIGKIAIKRGIPTIINYFNQKTSSKIIKKYGFSVYNIGELEEILSLSNPDVIQVPGNIFDNRFLNNKIQNRVV